MCSWIFKSISLTRHDQSRATHIYIAFQYAQYADMALIFVDSVIFTVFYLGSLFKVVSQKSQTKLEMIAVIELCSSMIQTLTTKKKETEQQAVTLADHNLLCDNCLYCRNKGL